MLQRFRASLALLLALAASCASWSSSTRIEGAGPGRHGAGALTWSFRPAPRSA